MRARYLTPLLFAAGCGCSGGSSSPDDALIPCSEGPPFEGEATYYDADGSGSCSFDPGGDLMVAAINDPDYDGGAWCGGCAEVEGPSGSVTVRIVDRCPGCASGDLDLSQEAFARIAAIEAGRVPISWRMVPCEVDGPLRYRFKEGSNPFWTAVQVRNHRHSIATLEARPADGAWRVVARESYNYFVDAGGLGDGPIALRVTDILGQVVEDDGIAPGDATEVSGGRQLPACE